MKKLITVFALFAMTVTAFAQTDDEIDAKLYGIGKMPYNENGEVVFSEVVTADGQQGSELYVAARMAVSDMFKSAKDVIQLDDKENCVIIAKGFRYQATKSKFLTAMGTPADKVFFTLKIQCRDGRYKIDIYQIKGHKDAQVVNGTMMQEYNIAAEALTDEECIKPNGKVKTTGYGYWRRMILDACRATLAQSKSEIAKNINTGENSTQDNW